MKKLLIVATLAPMMALAESTASANGYTWTYEKTGGSVTILDVNPVPSGHLAIPSSLGGSKVKWLNEGPCCPKRYSFDLSSVTSFDIPSSIEFVDRGDFEGTQWWRNQSGSVAISGEWAIGLRSNVANVTIPQGVKKIAVNFALECANLRSVSLPDGLKIICAQAFWTCSELRDVHIPSSVDTIGDWAFSEVPGPFYFHGKKPKSVDCLGRAYEGEDGDLFYSKESDSRVIYFKRGTSGWTDGGTWCGLRTYAWDPEGGGGGSGWTDKHTFNGLVSDSYGDPCGLIQVTTAKATKKGVRVSGFVMLEDGKKVTIKAVTVSANEQLDVYTSVGKIGSIGISVTENGFSGTLGSMKVASGGVSEDTGVFKATVTMSYFEAGTGKLKTKSLTMNGITVDGAAGGTLLNKKTKTTDQFWAEVECGSCSPSAR